MNMYNVSHSQPMKTYIVGFNNSASDWLQPFYAHDERQNIMDIKYIYFTPKISTVLVSGWHSRGSLLSLC